MPDSVPRSDRRRSPEQASAMTNALFSSFVAPPPAAPPPAPAEPELEARTSEPDAPVASKTPQGSGAKAAARTRPMPRDAQPAGTGAAGRGSGASDPEAQTARDLVGSEETATAQGRARARPRQSSPSSSAGVATQGSRSGVPRPVRPRLVDASAHATKHRGVRIARIQALLREGDLEVLDEIARQTIEQTGEDTNRSELLRALVEGLDVSGFSEALAGCGTHRQRVALIADRLQGTET
jgi:hypothetical protein